MIKIFPTKYSINNISLGRLIKDVSELLIVRIIASNQVQANSFRLKMWRFILA